MAVKNNRQAITHKSASPSSPGKRRLPSDVLSIFALLTFTAIIYYKAIFNDLIFFDDDAYILYNPFLRDQTWHGVIALFTHQYGANYHPFTSLIWFVFFSKFAFNPLPYHLVNVALHVLNTFLAFLFARKLSGHYITGLVVATFFAVHPLHVESVAWATELKDVLYTSFFLLSLYCYLKYLTTHSARHLIITFIFFVFSLLSKSAAVTLPVVLLMLDWYKTSKITRRNWLEVLPFFALSLIFGILTIHTQSEAISSFSKYGIINQVFLFTSGVAFYLIKLFVPYPLSAMHMLPPTNTAFLPWYYYGSLPLLVLTALLIFLARKRKYVLFGVTFFLVTISVMLQLVHVGFNLTAERYTYVPYIGLFYIAGEWIAGLAPQKTRMALIAAGCIAAAFSVITWYRIDVWKNDDVFFAEVINQNKYNSDACFPYFSWGNSLKSKGKLPDAYVKYTEAILRYPEFFIAYSSRGQVYDALGKTKEALADYNKAIALKPKIADAYNYRGFTYFELGDTQLAMADFSKAISLKDNFFEKITYPQVYNNQGWAYYCLKDTAKAIGDFKKAISIDSYFTRPYYNLAAVQINKSDFAGALETYNKAIEKAPAKEQEAYYTRGILRYNMKDANGACEDWHTAADMGNKAAEQNIRQYCR